jgi:hypothetical protein
MFCHSFLPQRAPLVTAGCEACGTKKPQPTRAGGESVSRLRDCQHQGGREPGRSGRVGAADPPRWCAGHKDRPGDKQDGGVSGPAPKPNAAMKLTGRVCCSLGGVALTARPVAYRPAVRR